MGTKNLTLAIPYALYLDLRKFAMKNNRTLADIVREGIKLVLQDKTHRNAQET